MLIKLVISRIYGNNNVWCYTVIGFLNYGSSEAVWQTFARFVKQQLIRKMLLGRYEYPEISSILLPSRWKTRIREYCILNSWVLAIMKNAASGSQEMSNKISMKTFQGECILCLC